MIKSISSTSFEFQWGERHSMISAEYWAACYGPYAFGKPRAVNYVQLSEKGYLETYASHRMAAEWRSLSKILLQKKNQDRVVRSSRQVRKAYFAFFRTFQKTHLSKRSNTEILQLLGRYRKILKSVGEYFVVSQAEGIDAVTKRLASELEKRSAGSLMSVLVTAHVPDIIAQERADLQALARRKNISRAALHKHALKHAWLFFNSYDVEENLRYLKLRLGERFDRGQKRRELQRLQERQQTIFHGLRSRHIRDLSLFLQRMAVERLELKNCWGGAEFRFLPLFHEIAKRIRVPFKVMMAAYTFGDYVRALLVGKRLSRPVVQRRSRAFAFHTYHDRIALIEDGKALRSMNAVVHGKVKLHKVATIQGVSANPGKVSGRCRLVRSIDIGQVLRDLSRFKHGDILVTWMTQPNMVPIVRKAAAIIADEGGITSHAAVIAREFNIPCIVGTKIATKILKDGQTVEVDGDNGIVRIPALQG